MPRASLPALFALVLAAAPAPAQFGDPPAKSKLPAKFAAMADVRVGVVPDRVKRGETVTIKLTIELKPGAGAHTYPFFPKDPAQTARNKFDLPPGELTLLAGNADPQAGLVQRPREGGGGVDDLYETTTTWEFKARASPA